MKRLIIYMFLLFAAFACSNDTVEKDNDNPLVYIPLKGFSLNEIWALDKGTDSHYLSVYCSGLYSGAGSDIEVAFSIDPSLIPAYNGDITQEYSGMLKELPSDCYKIAGTSVKIEKGKSAARIPIEFDIEKIKALDDDFYYGIPIRLASTSKYNLHDDEAYTNAIYGIVLKEPLFYFYNNRNEFAVQDYKVVYGTEQVVQYMLLCNGVPKGSYNVTVEYTPELLENYVEDGTVLPESSFEILNKNIVFESEHSSPTVDIKFKAEGMEYRTVYYLPVTITETSAYEADPQRNTLVVKVELKNEYEKTYICKFNIFNERFTRTKAYSVNKSITSYSNDIVEMQIGTNGSIAGATSETGTSSTFNNKYMRLKIVPGGDTSHYGLELILVDDSGKKDSPATLEFIPGSDSYYNSDREEFVLNYRWKDSKGYWMEVTETATAN